MTKMVLLYIASFLSFLSLAYAGSEEAQLQQAIQDRGYEEAKAKEMEEKALLKREQEERRLRQVQREITEQKYQIELFKQKQEKALQELESLNAEQTDLDIKLSEFKKEKEKYQQESAQTLSTLDSQLSEFTQKQKSLDKEVEELMQKRKRIEREITNKAVEIQTLKASASRMDTMRAELESKTAELETDEMRTRTEWMQTKVQAAESYKQRDLAQQRLAESKKKRDQAVKDLQIAQAELAKASKLRNEALKKTEIEVAKYEKEIQNAQKSRIFAESEQIRLDAELAKIREYGIRMKETRDQALMQADQSDALVWKSNLNLETARSELSQAVSGYDKKGFDLAKDQSRAKGMQEAAQAAEIVKSVQNANRQVSSVNQGPLWQTKIQCEAFEKPDRAAPKKGFLKQGQKFPYVELNAGWAKIQNSSGAVIYVEERCGQYADE